MAKFVKRAPGKSILEKMMHLLEEDELKGNKCIQFAELSDCLFGIYNQASISIYLTFNQASCHTMLI